MHITPAKRHSLHNKQGVIYSHALLPSGTKLPCENQVYISIRTLAAGGILSLKRYIVFLSGINACMFIAFNREYSST